MKRLARGDTPTECEKSRDRLKKNGWKAISDIKVDDSLAYMGEISYVVVMERPDEPGKTKKKWNSDLPIW